MELNWDELGLSEMELDPIKPLVKIKSVSPLDI